MEINIVRSEEGIPIAYAYTQEALTHYADEIPDWLNETPRSDLVHDLRDFGR
jgi:hypothetical protein